jgi:serine/threonine protein kinase
MAAAGQNPRNILESGGYGVVFSPALPNINAAGNPVDVTGYVTKAFFQEGAYEKALKDSKIIEKEIPSMYLPYTPYTRKVTYKNLPISAAKRIFAKTIDDPVYLIRMPNKGVPFSKIARIPTFRDEFAQLPLEVIATEFYKLMMIVYATGAAGYVHGDIREPNILVNTTTGTMTLIDFDLFGPLNTFVNEYPSPFYHLPPELFLLLQSRFPTDLGIFLRKFGIENQDLKMFMEEEFFDKEYKDINLKLYPSVKSPSGKNIPFQEAALSYAESLQGEIRNAISGKGYTTPREVVKDSAVVPIIQRAQGRLTATADSFSLAYCIRYLLDAIPDTDQQVKRFKAICNSVFEGMMHPDPRKRKDIHKGLDMFKLSMKVLLKIRLPEATVANAVKIVEVEAARMATMATGAVAPTQLPDAIIEEEIQKRLTIYQIADGSHEKNLALTDLVNFLRLNAVSFLAKGTSSGMRNNMINNCHNFLKDPKCSVELNEACTAYLTVFEPSSKSATRKNKSPSPVKAANSPKSVKATSLNSTKKAEASKQNSSSKSSKSAKSAVQAVQQLAAAAEAVEEMPDPAAGATKKPTRAEKKKLYWKKQRERRRTKKAAAGANA